MGCFGKWKIVLLDKHKDERLDERVKENRRKVIEQLKQKFNKTSDDTSVKESITPAKSTVLRPLHTSSTPPPQSSPTHESQDLDTVRYLQSDSEPIPQPCSQESSKLTKVGSSVFFTTSALSLATALYQLWVRHQVRRNINTASAVRSSEQRDKLRYASRRALRRALGLTALGVASGVAGVATW